MSPWSRLKNSDPNRHYVWVHLASPYPEYGVEGYEARGYQIEKKRPDGPQPWAGKTVQDGEPIEMRGNVLMSAPRERFEEIEQYGEDGTTGQSDADRIEQIIIKQRGGLDPLRGLGVRGRSGVPFVSVENDIRPLEEEEA